MRLEKNRVEEQGVLSGLKLPLKIWEVLYPLGIYYSVIVMAMVVLRVFIGAEADSYMLRQILTGIVAIPVAFSYYRRDQRRFPGKSLRESLRQPGELWMTLVFSVTLALLLGTALNNLISMSPLVRLSEGYGRASRDFYGSTIGLELLGAAVVTPIQEELMYRGVIHGRIRQMIGLPWSVVLSSLIFGLMHFNVVQLVYASLLGAILALLVEWTGQICSSTVAHMAVNLLAVLRTELHLMERTMDGSAFAWCFSVGTLIAGIALLGFWHRRLRRQSLPFTA